MPDDFGSVSGKSYRLVLLRLVVLLMLFFAGATLAASRTPDSGKVATANLAQQEKGGQVPRGKAPSYIDEPLDQLIRDVPDLQTLQPVAGQQELARILQKTGARVDEFLRNLVGLIADEQITQQREESQTEGTQEVQDSYVIVPHRSDIASKLEEYRAGTNGNRLTQVGPDKFYFVKTGFASSRQYFSTAFQQQSDFRYLGEDVMDSRETYVVAFAQKPPQEGVLTGKDTGALTQGIAWVDKTSFQIIRMQTDLFVRRKEMGLRQLRMLVKFGEVLPAGGRNALWLPTEAQVHAEAGESLDFELKFQNEHYFTNYRLYDAATASMAHPETREQNPYANAHPYLDEPLETLVKRIPELKTLRPATDQQLLPMILQKTGERVDDVFGSLTGLKAKELVSEQEFTWAKRAQLLQDQYDYFIVRRGNLVQANLKEFRRDTEGKESTSATMFLSGGFVLSVRYFSIALQQQSNYLFLGEEMVGARSTYVVAFAQIPGTATSSVRASIQQNTQQVSQFDPGMGKQDVKKLDVLVQGIAWIDRTSFQILRLQTDLLPSKIHWEVQAPFFDKTLQELRTTVTFSEVQSPELPNSTWMPSEADVHAVIENHYWYPVAGYELYQDRWFHNTHRFSDYQPYREPESLARTEQREDEEAHPYLEEPVKQLIKRIPDLMGIRPAADQQALPMILAKTGERVDEFFNDLVDVIAHEEITQAQLSRSGAILASEAVGDSYLILRHGSKKGADIEEYRMDKQGNEIDQVGLDKGFFVTSGFALSSVHLSTSFQSDSRFLYLGDQKIAGRDTYVVAYAQLPKQARIKVTLRGPRGATVHMLTQGTVWVDKRTFHILRMRTDLLARQPEIGLDEQTTKVNFVEVHLADLATPLWLPHEAIVYVKFGKFGDQRFEVAFQNVHHYTNYRRYRVSTKMVIPK